MIKYEPDLLKKYITDIFKATGSFETEAQTVAEHLIDANLVGHDSHGVIRVKHYISWLKKGWITPNRTPEIIKDNGTVLVIDGGLGYGQVTAKDAMTLGAARAMKNGACIVSIRNTTHLGRLGAWAEMLARQGLVSIHFANSSGFGIRVAPHGGNQARFSTNPICIGSPVKSSEPIILDMSTAKIPDGKILVAANKGEDLPEGYILDGEGKPTRDPQGFFEEPKGAVLPIAGPKGSGLAFMIEILAGALSGGHIGHPDNQTAHQVENNMLSIIINPDEASGCDVFGMDVTRLIAWTKSCRPSAKDEGILLPGERSRKTRQLRLNLGIPLDGLTITELGKVATSLGVAIPETFKKN